MKLNECNDVVNFITNQLMFWEPNAMQQKKSLRLASSSLLNDSHVAQFINENEIHVISI